MYTEWKEAFEKDNPEYEIVGDPYTYSKETIGANMESVITEYEILFGEPTRMSLFADDEKSYKTFRQSIIDSPREEYDPSAPLPFEGVVLLKYEY